MLPASWCTRRSEQVRAQASTRDGVQAAPSTDKRGPGATPEDVLRALGRSWIEMRSRVAYRFILERWQGHRDRGSLVVYLRPPRRVAPRRTFHRRNRLGHSQGHRCLLLRDRQGSELPLAWCQGAAIGRVAHRRAERCCGRGGVASQPPRGSRLYPVGSRFTGRHDQSRYRPGEGDLFLRHLSRPACQRMVLR